ncbi:hypothetical protein H2198_009468 [Neophaeococcomyces mojaviensis]|uniref:Uncharacterized protein n=1 Tax=Neophaeococcomyces mojaviensis TaxID=3383035 RepID=A0ACC2ZU92_9EURO|nr:hypothetical protein H2198_009468 [Knufia sp. JES_112]
MATDRSTLQTPTDVTTAMVKFNSPLLAKKSNTLPWFTLSPEIRQMILDHLFANKKFHLKSFEERFLATPNLRLRARMDVFCVLAVSRTFVSKQEVVDAMFRAGTVDAAGLYTSFTVACLLSAEVVERMKVLKGKKDEKVEEG